jgi:hypothetical protein
MSYRRRNRRYLTTFATPDFEPSLAGLVASALRFGIDEARPWFRQALERTSFYREHRLILDQPRGSGYWLWKPFIIRSLLEEAGEDDIVVYADAAITVLRPLAPLFELCRRQRGILVFRGHYDRSGGPSPCRAWTKRDGFVLAGCDTRAFHDAPMLDASFLVFENSRRARAFVDEWLDLCSDPRILTDARNTCGLPNLPDFVDHRHDQSVLSLLAARDAIRAFRPPSQYGNHLKPRAYRRRGEWLRAPYGTGGTDTAARYDTLLFHHRKRALVGAPPRSPTSGPTRVTRRDRALSRLRHQAARRLARPGDALLALGTQVPTPIRLLSFGGAPNEHLVELCRRLPGASVFSLENGASPRVIERPRTIGSGVLWRIKGGGRALAGWLHAVERPFNMILSAAPPKRALRDLDRLLRLRLLDESGYVACWSGLSGLSGWAAFRTMRRTLLQTHRHGRLSPYFGLVGRAGARGPAQTVGIVTAPRVVAPFDASREIQCAVPSRVRFLPDRRRMNAVVRRNRAALGEVDSWIDAGAMERSLHRYGLPPAMARFVDSPVGNAATYSDLLVYLGEQLHKPVRYLEIGVSLGKNFYQLLRSLACADMVGFDVEDINPALERRLVPDHAPFAGGQSTPGRRGDGNLRTYRAPGGGPVHYLAGDLFDPRAWQRLRGRAFNLIFSDAHHSPAGIRTEYRQLLALDLLDRDELAIVWDDLHTPAMLAEFADITGDLARRLRPGHSSVGIERYGGWLGRNEPAHVVGIFQYSQTVIV